MTLPRETVDLSILMVSWRTRDLTVRGVGAAVAAMDQLGARGTSAELVVVDNDSGDGTVEALDERFGSDLRVTVVANPTNQGFAGGNNQAVALARGRVLAVSNPDVVLTAGVLEAAMTCLDIERGADVVSCRLVGEDGREQTIHRALPSLLSVALTATRTGRRVDSRLFGGRGGRKARLNGRVEGAALAGHRIARVGQPAGAFLVLERDLLPHIGGALFDERFPLLFSDVDLGRRVRDAGRSSVILTDHWLRHTGGASLRQLDATTLEQELWHGLRTYYARHESLWKNLAVRCLAPGRVRGTGSSASADALSARAAALDTASRRAPRAARRG